MDGAFAPSVCFDIVSRAEAPAGSTADTIAAIRSGLGDVAYGLITVFASPLADVGALSSALVDAYPEAEIVGCTTAGEIGGGGYVEGHVVAVGFPKAAFDVEIILIETLRDFDTHAVAAETMRAQARQQRRHPRWPHEFGLLLIDGLSLREDQVAATASAAMGSTPFFGASAGDGLAFGETLLFHGARIWRDAALLVRVRTVCPVRIFKLDHLRPTDAKMVVTEADPVRRIVREINAEPAAQEYARVLGKDPEQLSPFIFAAHPLLVKIGEQHHVRSIRQVLPNGDLVFFSAIDEGLVLTLAEAADIVSHLDDGLRALADPAPPAAVIACDCILRKLEAEQSQAAASVSRVLSKHGVVGLNTYGEQINGAHVNQTLTGLAIFAPEGGV